MNKKNPPATPVTGSRSDPVPPGATKAAFDRDRDEAHGGAPHTPLDDRHAAGQDVTGLAGREDGDTRDQDSQDRLENGPPYSGHAGGSAGGTPAERRASGGKIDGGIAPSDDTRSVDSTLGTKPSAKPRKKR